MTGVSRLRQTWTITVLQLRRVFLARREVLLLGKYLAGLIASIAIFSLGAALCYLVMLWPHEAVARAAFWPDPGAPLLVQLFIAPAAPPTVARAVFGLLALTAVVLWIAALSVRRLEINYSAD
jgi:hypothetical protein